MPVMVINGVEEFVYFRRIFNVQDHFAARSGMGVPPPNYIELSPHPMVRFSSMMAIRKIKELKLDYRWLVRSHLGNPDTLPFATLDLGPWAGVSTKRRRDPDWWTLFAFSSAEDRANFMLVWAA